MPTITDCVTLQSSSTTLAYPTGDRDYTAAEFDAPAANLGARGVLMFRVVPVVGDASIKLKWILNDEVVSDVTYRSDIGRTWHEIFEGNILKLQDNELKAELTAGNGSVIVSDITVWFQANI
jgi:hypothetical protein